MPKMNIAMPDKVNHIEPNATKHVPGFTSCVQQWATNNDAHSIVSTMPSLFDGADNDTVNAFFEEIRWIKNNFRKFKAPWTIKLKAAQDKDKIDKIDKDRDSVLASLEKVWVKIDAEKAEEAYVHALQDSHFSSQDFNKTREGLWTETTSTSTPATSTTPSMTTLTNLHSTSNPPETRWRTSLQTTLITLSANQDSHATLQMWQTPSSMPWCHPAWRWQMALPALPILPPKHAHTRTHNTSLMEQMGQCW